MPVRIWKSGAVAFLQAAYIGVAQAEGAALGGNLEALQGGKGVLAVILTHLHQNQIAHVLVEVALTVVGTQANLDSVLQHVGHRCDTGVAQGVGTGLGEMPRPSGP